MTERKIILVTGANSGLGHDVARQAVQAGYTVYACDRNTDNLAKLALPRANALPVDVTDQDAIRRAVDTVIGKEGRIDVLVNAAGLGLFGNVENTPDETIRLLFEVNFFGYMRMIRAVLPHMRCRRQGLIINTGSGSGAYATPLCGYYCATKFAVEALSDALRQEVSPFGIQVVLIEPGYFKSNISASILAGLNSTSYDPDYEPLFRGFRGKFPEMWNSGAEVGVVSGAVMEAIRADLPETRYYPIRSVLERIAMKRSMSDREFDLEMMREINWPD